MRELYKRFLGMKISGQCSEPIQKLLPVQRLQSHRFFFWLKTLTELWLALRISRFSTVFRKLLCPFLVFIKKRKKKLKGKENGVWMKESSAGTLYSAKKRKVRELHKRFLGTKISGQCSEPIQKLLPVQRLQTHRLFFFWA